MGATSQSSDPQGQSVRVALMASGRGSNAESIYSYFKNSKKALIPLLICDQENAGILDLAKDWDLHLELICANKDMTKEERRKEQENRMMNLIRSFEIDLLALAGYKKILSHSFLEQMKTWTGDPLRILNIHPSLLPLFPGLNGYQKAFESKVSHSGVTVHYVDQGMDTGLVITQACFERKEEDGLEDFEKRGLGLEHMIYPQCIAQVVESLYFQKNKVSS